MTFGIGMAVTKGASTYVVSFGEINPRKKKKETGKWTSFCAFFFFF
jgi:hypothetical protein